jgi:putative ABC transport system substrate-binding protein
VAIETENFVFEFRYTEGKDERAPQLARELVALRPDILVVTLGEPGIRALKEATTTIPIVMLVSADPVGTGLVASLARPGGNITGMSILGPETAGKRLGLQPPTSTGSSRAPGLRPCPSNSPRSSSWSSTSKRRRRSG